MNNAELKRWIVDRINQSFEWPHGGDNFNDYREALTSVLERLEVPYEDPKLKLGDTVIPGSGCPKNKVWVYIPVHNGADVFVDTERLRPQHREDLPERIEKWMQP